MLKEPNSIHATTAAELALLNEPIESENLFPPSQETQDEQQIAVNGKLSSEFGPLIGRIFSVDVSNTFGSAYHKLKKLQWEAEQQKLRDQGIPDPLEAAAESLDPNKPKPAVTDRPPSAEGLKVEDLKIYGSGEGTLEFGPAIIPARISDDSVANDDYIKHLTVGEPDLDRIIAERAAGDPNMVDGMIAGIRAVGKGGDDKIPDEGHVRHLLGSMGNFIERKLAGKTDDELKTISLQQMNDMANLLGENPERLKQNFMGGLHIKRNKAGRLVPGHLAAQMIAGKNLLISELKVLDKITDEAVNAPIGPVRDAARLAWRQQAELVAQLQSAFKGTQTEIARALSGFRSQNITDAKLLSRNVESILDEVGGGDGIDKAINAYQSAESVIDRAEIAKAFANKATKWDAAHEVWINSILSGPWTHVKNLTGNAVMILGDNLETLGAAGIQAITKGTRGLQRDVTFGDVQAKMFGQMMSMREALVSGGKAAWYREDPNFLGKGSKFDQPNAIGRADAFSAAGMELSGTWGRAVDAIGSTLTLGRSPMRALQAGDAFYKTVAYRGSLYEQGYRSGRSEGLEGDALSTHIAEFVFSPPEDAIIKAQDHAKYVTLQTEMAGSWKTWQRAFQGRYTRWIVPFYKTPTNAILYVGERSPAALIMKRYRLALKAGGEEAIKANTRMALGSAAMLALGWEYSADNITGGLSSSPRVRAAYLRQGISPYSVRIGGEWVSYAAMEPISTLIGLVADTMEIANHPDTDQKTAWEAVAAISGAIGYNMTNKTFLAGLAKFLDAIRDPQRRMESFFKQYAASFVPGSSMANEIRKLNDDLLRFKTGYVDVLKSRLPGLSTDLKPRRDLWGREVSSHRLRSPYRPNMVDKEMVRLGIGLGDHPDHYSKEVEFSPGERDWFHQHAGELAFKRIKQFMEDPRSGFKKLQKASIAGDLLAGEEIKHAFQRELVQARKEMRDKLLTLPLAQGLRDELDRVEREKIKKYLEFEEAVK